MLDNRIRRYTGCILLLLLAAFLLGCSGASTPNVNTDPTPSPSPTPTPSGSGTTISGHVFSSGAPLEGARVRFLDRIMNTVSGYENTAADGSFVLQNVTTGSKRLFITKTGFHVVRRDITVQSGGNPLGNFTATPGNNPEIFCAVFDSSGILSSPPIIVYGVNFQLTTGAPVPVVLRDGSPLEIIGENYGSYTIMCAWPSSLLSGTLVVQAGSLTSDPYTFSPYSPDYSTPTPTPTPTPTVTPSPTPSGSSSPTASPTPTPSPSVKQWTILVYLDGDNNLENAAFTDFNEMEQIGSSDQVNIIVQFDRYSASSHCKRYYVTADQDVYNITSPVLQDLGNVDMASSASLLSFLNYGISQYPANHYMVILWDHGSGWKAKAPRSAATKGICYDDHGANPDVPLSIHNLRDVFVQVRTTLGKNIDVLGFDACLMQLFEVAWGLKDSTDYMVGSEESIPDTGWVYYMTLYRLVDNPSMTSEQLANYFVDDYFSYTFTFTDGITMSALDTSKAASVMSSLNSFAQILTQKMSTYKSDLQTIDRATQYYGYPYYTDYSDLYDFARRVKEGISDAQIQSAAQSLMSSITAFVVDEKHSQNSVGDSHGLSIWLPGGAQYNSEKDDYSSKLSFFTSASSWDEFLAALWAP